MASRDQQSLLRGGGWNVRHEQAFADQARAYDTAGRVWLRGRWPWLVASTARHPVTFVHRTECTDPPT